ncbi:hypothetical protein CRE_21783 [Caenorhabditis remanei]|uniref:SCP domain-containing protein n=1 Tax=Caenorhabditis remanei TaxID=31234 RepID=E3MEF9_CAERE|nr:hypothetical protein CRE_21783 [Caenorhabditis remanei]
MMLNFFITIILLFAATTVSASPAALHTGFQQKNLEHINSFRSRFANAAQIANMQKMRYNRTLEAAIQNYTSSCDLLDDMEDMPTYAILDKKFIDSHILQTEIHQDHLEIYEDYMEMFLGPHRTVTHILHPLATQVGCALMTTPCKWPRSHEISLKDHNGEWSKIDKIQTICLVGKVAAIEGNGRIYGTPGSKCLEGQKDGLCVSKDSCVCDNF